VLTWCLSGHCPQSGKLAGLGECLSASKTDRQMESTVKAKESRSAWGANTQDPAFIWGGGQTGQRKPSEWPQSHRRSWRII
jgi:hypothetical protein